MGAFEMSRSSEFMKGKPKFSANPLKVKQKFSILGSKHM